jgi:hypothetical protein
MPIFRYSTKTKVFLGNVAQGWEDGGSEEESRLEEGWLEEGRKDERADGRKEGRLEGGR